MTNSNPVEVLKTHYLQQVGLISHTHMVQQGGAIEVLKSQEDSPGLFIVDSVDDEDMARIAGFAIDWPLTTGPDALFGFLARTLLDRMNQQPNTTRKNRTHLPASPGCEVVVAGSCAEPTLSQIEHFENNNPVSRVDLLAAARKESYLIEVFDWIASKVGEKPIAIATSVDVPRLQEIQAVLSKPVFFDTALNRLREANERQGYLA